MSVTIPEIKDLLKTGIQFGHTKTRWNPKMSQFIFTSKNNIHVVDVVKTHSQLAAAVKLITEIAKTKTLMFVGSKRQAADIVKSEAIRVGAHFMVNRWPGGMFTNFKMVKQSLAKLNSLERSFEEGVQGRTKYEVNQMKNEWMRLNRLYSGVKQMNEYPGAIIVIDPRYERVAVKEANLAGIPVIALTDTNCDPDMVDLVIPGNDDALAAIELIVKLLAETTLEGNQGKGITHKLIDYTTAEIAIFKAVSKDADEVEVVVAAKGEEDKPQKVSASPARLKVSSQQLAKATGSKGILEGVKDQQNALKPKATTKKTLVAVALDKKVAPQADKKAK